MVAKPTNASKLQQFRHTKINFGILMPLCRGDVAAIYMPKRASLSFWLSEFYPNIYCYHKAMTNLAEHWNIHGSILAVRLPVPPGVAVAWTGAPFAAARLPPAPGQRNPLKQAAYPACQRVRTFLLWLAALCGAKYLHMHIISYPYTYSCACTCRCTCTCT